MGGDDKTDIEKLAEKAYDVTDFYVESGPVVRLCTSSKFENTTFGVIGINALYMGIDSDNNTADMIDTAHITFQLCESLFCIYFTFELTVRFMSFKLKRNCFRDGWFSFDFILVSLMISETWILPLALGGAEMPIDVQFLRLLPGLEIRSTSNPVVHTRTWGSFSAVSTPIFATK